MPTGVSAANWSVRQEGWGPGDYELTFGVPDNGIDFFTPLINLRSVGGETSYIFDKIKYWGVSGGFRTYRIRFTSKSSIPETNDEWLPILWIRI